MISLMLDLAQAVIDELVQAGVRGILNYAPIAPVVPPNTVIRNIDPVLSLQSMTFYLMKEGINPLVTN